MSFLSVAAVASLATVILIVWGIASVLFYFLAGTLDKNREPSLFDHFVMLPMYAVVAVVGVINRASKARRARRD